VLPDGATPFKQGNVVRDSADAERSNENAIRVDEDAAGSASLTFALTRRRS